MARTRASVGLKVGVGKSSKAVKNAPPPPPPKASVSAPKRERSSRSKYTGGNPVCPRPTPKWQKPITNFFPRVNSPDSNDELAAGSSKTKDNDNVILPGKESTPEKPVNRELDETIELEPLNGVDSHKIEEYYPPTKKVNGSNEGTDEEEESGEEDEESGEEGEESGEEGEESGEEGEESGEEGEESGEEIEESGEECDESGEHVKANGVRERRSIKKANDVINEESGEDFEESDEAYEEESEYSEEDEEFEESGEYGEASDEIDDGAKGVSGNKGKETSRNAKRKRDEEPPEESREVSVSKKVKV